MAPPDAEEYESQRKLIESLKAELGALKYSLSTLEQEKQMADARHQSDLEDQKRKAQEDFEKKQAAESERSRAVRQLESIQNELAEFRDNSENDRAAMEKKTRDAEEEARLLQEQLEDLSSAKDEAARINEKKILDIHMQLGTSQREIQELEQQGQARELVLQQTQAQLAEKDTLIGNLEADVLRLKAHTGDADTMAIIKRELSEQVQHIRSLEATNREQLAELKHLRQIHKAVEVVEEEKRSLQRKLETAQGFETELAEARIQRQRLEDEKLEWSAYLKSIETDSDMEFDSPEAVARALVEERLASVSHLEQVGALRAELSAQEATIKSLEEEQAKLKTDLESAKTNATSTGSDRIRMRLDRQRTLAIQEVEMLRAQLRTFESEEITFNLEKYDETRAERIKELEALIDSYKTEIRNLHTELSSHDSPTESAAVGNKRPRLEDGSAGSPKQEQLSQLARKNRKLQEELSSIQTKMAVLQKDFQVSQEQLSAAKAQSKVRVLALRSNPTSDFENIKLETLSALRKENEELLAHMQSSKHAASFPTIPASMLDAAKREVAEAKAETASSQKSARRLKEVWSAKSAEFKEAIFSTLGWTVTFIPNGKMRVESVFYPSNTDEHENSIVFDGEKGTMKVGGGPRSAFARRINDQIKFWVREKGCIPGFLAALTLEFYEEHTRATTKG
jgi:mitotic spindle assembly checkpoint protein MAD1